VVLSLQITAVNWAPAQTVMHTTALSLNDWLVAAGAAASILVFEELRKLILRLTTRGS